MADRTWQAVDRSPHAGYDDGAPRSPPQTPPIDHRDPVLENQAQPRVEIREVASRGDLALEAHEVCDLARPNCPDLIAIVRTILVIIWHLLTSRPARFRDLGSGYYASRTDTDKKTRNHIRQLEALGFTVALTLAA
jgi:hypothetical protein